MSEKTQPSRREFLARAGNGFGIVALADLLGSQTSLAAPLDLDRAANPYAVRVPHHAPRAKRCLFLYMPGGPSHVDLFDPKPRVAAMNGQPLPFAKPSSSAPRPAICSRHPGSSKHRPVWHRDQRAAPHTSRLHADDLCVIRSMVADNINHTGACLQMNTGEQAFSRPSLGSWLVYGLGTENQNLPAFVVVSPAAVFQGAQLWSSSFLPSSYQGTLVRDLSHPIANLSDPSSDAFTNAPSSPRSASLIDLHKRDRMFDSQLDARIASFELAFRMQRNAPEAFDIERESVLTRRLYGIGEPDDRSVWPAVLAGPPAARTGRTLRPALRRAGEQCLGPSRRSSRKPAEALRGGRPPDRGPAA